jgi:hypothetical protein|tara:strand:- start:39 stop:152 length:114 start_codon:yes stop_codon:yes gene_type:complete
LIAKAKDKKMKRINKKQSTQTDGSGGEKMSVVKEKWK